MRYIKLLPLILIILCVGMSPMQKRIAMSGGQTSTTITIQEVSWWPNCVFLSHFDGADAATTATDISTEGAGSPHTINFNGDAQIDTGLTDAFGGNAGVLLLDGNDDVDCAYSTDWNFGTSAFTVSGWFRTTTWGAGTVIQRLMSHGNIASENGAWAFGAFRSSSVTYLSWAHRNAGSIVDIFGAATINVDTWYHLEATGDGSTIRIFLDGTLITTGTQHDLTLGSGVMAIGSKGSAAEYLTGQIDEPLILKGEALHTSGFTPPTAPYSRY